MKAASISPHNPSCEVADTVETKEECVKCDRIVDELKDDESQKVEGSGRAECHPVEASEVVDQEEVNADAEEEYVSPGGLRDPGQPSPAERAEHDLTHIPYRSWCKHCVRGKAKGRQSRRIRGDAAESTCPRIRLDYCMITDKSHGEDGDADGGDEDIATEANDGDGTGEVVETGDGDDRQASAAESVWGKPDGVDDGDNSATILVMQESLNRSVWAYGVQSKGVSESWVIDQTVPRPSGPLSGWPRRVALRGHDLEASAGSLCPLRPPNRGLEGSPFEATIWRPQRAA